MKERSLDNLQNEHLRGVKAQELLGNSLMAEVLEMMERDLFDRFKACESTDAASLAELRRLVGAHQKFTNILRGYIATGEHAARLIADATKRESATARALNRWRA